MFSCLNIQAFGYQSHEHLWCSQYCSSSKKGWDCGHKCQEAEESHGIATVNTNVEIVVTCKQAVKFKTIPVR